MGKKRDKMGILFTLQRRDNDTVEEVKRVIKEIKESVEQFHPSVQLLLLAEACCEFTEDLEFVYIGGEDADI
jgi:hypothetical protein